MKVSFLLPTNRDHEIFASHIIKNINETCHLEKEILVYSPDEIEGENVKWYKEEPPFEGCIEGYNFLYKQSKGDYVVTINDESGFWEGVVAAAINILESEYYEKKKLKIIGLGSNLGTFPNSDVRGGYSCIPTFGLKTPQGYRICGYPVFQRDTVEDYLDGYIFHPEFKHHYADNYLPFYAGLLGEPLNDCPASCCVLVTKNESAVSRTDTNDHDVKVYERLIRELDAGTRKSYVN